MHTYADKILRTGKYLNVIQQCDEARADFRSRRHKKKRVVIFNSFSDVIDGNEADEADEGIEGGKIYFEVHKILTGVQISRERLSITI